MDRRKRQFGPRPLLGEESRNRLTTEPSHGYAMLLGQPLEALVLVGVDVYGEPFLGRHCILLQSAAVPTLWQAPGGVKGGGAWQSCSEVDLEICGDAKCAFDPRVIRRSKFGRLQPTEAVR